MAQGMGGLMDLTGTPDGEPTRVGIPVSDIFTGCYSVVGILAALHERERTAKGAYVDTALVDSTVGVLSNQALNYLVSGKVPKRIGNAHANIVPYQVFPTADGYAIVATGNDAQYVKFCNVLGAPELGQDAKYKDNVGRLGHREELIGKLSALTMKMKRDDLLNALEAQGVPAGPINDVAQVFEDPQVVYRGMKLDLPTDAAKAGSIPGVRTPIVIDGWKAASEKPAPLLGEHTQEILREIGEA
jgi:crotonobetainyl-CoA:carnitine CoA-transferase CaiB-like acyl-CoA transferase